MLHQFAHETLSCLRISVTLQQNIKCVAMLIYDPLQPVLFATYRDHHLIQMPFITSRKTIAPDRLGVLPTEFTNPIPDHFSLVVDANQYGFSALVVLLLRTARLISRRVLWKM